jgi:hypothetical protein
MNAAATFFYWHLMRKCRLAQREVLRRNGESGSFNSLASAKRLSAQFRLVYQPGVAKFLSEIIG